MINQLKAQFRKLMPYLILAEATSYLGHYLPWVETSGFIILAISAVYLGYKKYDYLLGLVIVELVIGSKGHLFNITIGNLNLSIRMIFWLITLFYWFYYFFVDLNKSENKRLIFNDLLFINRFGFFWPLLLFTAFAVINGFIHHNNLGNIYNDANGWLYLLLLWPAAMVTKNWNKEKQSYYFQIIVVAISWLTIKTWLILYFFSHEFIIIGDFYKWIRVSGVGEITEMKKSFYRIFIQSHIYILAGLVISWLYLARQTAQKKFRHLINSPIYLFWLSVASLLFSVILIGLSRSFWVGLIFAITNISFSVYFNNRERKYFFYNLVKFFSTLIVSLLVSLFLIFIIIKFPIPRNTLEFDATSVLSDRATEVNESAIGSRWALLPILGSAIERHWFIGQGFGSTITYLSKDPRIVEKTGGKFTTFTFEWGWLDIWLKLGLLGLFSYIYILHHLWKSADKTEYSTEIKLVLITIISLHVFTPYLNHPLGIGIILMISAIISNHTDLPNRLKSYILQLIKK